MTTYYYIDEIQNRPDGVANVQATVIRSTLANALSYYYERHSKLAPSTTFTSYCLSLKDNHGNEIQPWAEYECTAYEPETATETAE